MENNQSKQDLENLLNSSAKKTSEDAESENLNQIKVKVMEQFDEEPTVKIAENAVAPEAWKNQKKAYDDAWKNNKNQQMEDDI